LWRGGDGREDVRGILLADRVRGRRQGHSENAHAPKDADLVLAEGRVGGDGKEPKLGTID
jgi:hypothetical protein